MSTELDPSGETNPFDTTKESGGRTIVIPDMSGISEDDPWYLKPGQYVGTVTDVIDDVSKSSGNPMLRFQFDVEPEDGRKPIKISQFLVKTQGGMFRLKQTVTALGLEMGEIDVDHIKGKKCMLEIGDNMYEGKKRSRVVRALPMPAGPDPSDDLSF